MSLASGLVLGGRHIARPAMPATVVMPQRAAVQRRYGSRRAAVMARGIVWAALLFAACALGSTAVALVMIPAALIASVSAIRVMPERDIFALAVAVGGPAVAAICFIIADAQSANLGLTLALLVCLYDAACYVNGHGRGVGGWTGITAGLLSVGVLAILVAAVLVPPFSGVTPWLVVGFTGLMAPLGVALATAAPGWSRLPALRRLDSMILAAPVWVILVALFVHS